MHRVDRSFHPSRPTFIGPDRIDSARAMLILGLLALLVPIGAAGCGGATSPNAQAVLAGPEGKPSPFEDDSDADFYSDPMYNEGQRGRSR